jgi:DNA replication protein DnaC
MNERQREADPVLRAHWEANTKRHIEEAMRNKDRLAEQLKKRAAERPSPSADAMLAEMIASDGHPRCTTCDSARQVIGIDGGLKPCPACGHIWRNAHASSMAQYSSAAGRATGQEFDNFVPRTKSVTSAKTLCEAFATTLIADRAGEDEMRARWLVLWGGPGCGKSHLLGATYNLCKRSGIAPIFVTMPDLLASLKALFDAEGRQAEGETSSQRMAKYQSAELLILDDLGAEQQTPWAQGALFELIDARYRNQAPTLIASNLDMRVDGSKVFDARCVSRWNDIALSRVHKIDAEDFRKARR